MSFGADEIDALGRLNYVAATCAILVPTNFVCRHEDACEIVAQYDDEAEAGI